MKHLLSLACGIALLWAQGADAAVVTPTKGNGDFIAGSGIPGDGFTVASGPNGEELGLKARGRDTGQPLFQSGNVYHVQPGFANNGTSPWWNFDFQFSPGENGLNPSQYVLGLFVDFDPSPATNFVSMIMPVGNVPVDSWEDTDGFFTNPGPGGWSNDNIPYVVSNSLNLGFAFWQSQFGAPPFNPNARGIYEISLVLLNGADTLARTTIFVNVVPEPGSMAMLFGAAVCGVPMLRRRFRKK